MAIEDLRKQISHVLTQQDKDNGWRRFQVSNYPDYAESGPLVLGTFTQDENKRVAAIIKEGIERDPGSGKFHKLVEKITTEDGKPGRLLWMSDTRAEIQEHYEFFNVLEDSRHVKGLRLLINGLGLGMVTCAALKYPNVEVIDVVEANLDVIKLISPLITDPRVYFHHDDAYSIEWSTRHRWDYIWHDIWPTINDENLEGMDRLRTKYRKLCHWQGFWRRDGCEAQAKVFRLMENKQLSQRDAWLMVNGIAPWRLDDVVDG